MKPTKADVREAMEALRIALNEAFSVSTRAGDFQTSRAVAAANVALFSTLQRSPRLLDETGV